MVVVLGLAFFVSPHVAAIVAILAVLEVSLSFDNAVVNAKILGRMNAYWQKIFLTVGVAIAVFGMRLVFPVAVVAIAAHLGPGTVIDLALHHASQYAAHLRAAHGVIAAFGGMFLLMIFLDFLFEEREVKWLPFERWATNKTIMGEWEGWLRPSMLIATVVLVTFGQIFPAAVAYSGLAGTVTYLVVGWLSERFENAEGIARAGIFTFLYLEVLDASFSFDGVTGAFAVSDQVLVIAVGLGLGALFVRSLTVYLVRAGTLAEYRYLEHGAHYAIGALALLLFVSIKHTLPELVTGLVGVAFIGAAFTQSLIANRGQYDKKNKSGSLPRPS